MSELRSFHIGDILTITTGRMVAKRHMEAVYDILNYMTGDELFTHQLPRAARQARPSLLRQYPHLSKVDDGRIAEALEKGAESGVMDFIIAGWLARQAELFGETLPVQPIPPGEYMAQDPIDELQAMRGSDRGIVVVHLPGA